MQWKPRLWISRGREQLQALNLERWASQRRHDLLQLSAMLEVQHPRLYRVAQSNSPGKCALDIAFVLIDGTKPRARQESGLHPPRNDLAVCGLKVGAGKVIGKYQRRHRSQEFLKFLEEVDRQLQAGSPVHLVMDNYGPHRAFKVDCHSQCHPEQASAVV